MNRFPGNERDWSRQYAAVGKFVVEFEWICSRTRFLAGCLLQANGLKLWPLGEIMLNQRSMTAEPLFSCFASMVVEAFGPSHCVSKQVAAIRIEFQELCKMRNDLLHASYLIGDDVVEITDKAAPTEILVMKRTPNKSGDNVQTLATRIDELDVYVEKASSIKKQLWSFMSDFLLAINHEEMGNKEK